MNMFNMISDTLIVQGFDNNIYKYVLENGIFDVNEYVSDITSSYSLKNVKLSNLSSLSVPNDSTIVSM